MATGCRGSAQGRAWSPWNLDTGVFFQNQSVIHFLAIVCEIYYPSITIGYLLVIEMLKTYSECGVCPECQVPATVSLFPRWPMFIYELSLMSLANFCCECLILQLKAMWLVRIQRLINYLIIQLINIARAGCLHSCSTFTAHEKEWQEIFSRSLASLSSLLIHLEHHVLSFKISVA